MTVPKNPRLASSMALKAAMKPLAKFGLSGTIGETIELIMLGTPTLVRSQAQNSPIKRPKVPVEKPRMV